MQLVQEYSDMIRNRDRNLLEFRFSDEGGSERDGIIDRAGCASIDERHERSQARENTCMHRSALNGSVNAA